MKAVIVTYQVKPEFADVNAANIRAVMDEIRAWNDPGIRYQSFTKEDGVTFVHFGMYVDDDAVERMGHSEAFKKFQEALRASSPVSPPKAEWLNNVGAMYNVFAG